MIAALSSTSTLWYVSRGAGTIVLVILTVTVVLGIITAGGWRSREWPRFVSENLHRNLSLLALVLLVLHVVTVVLDPYAHLRWRDAFIPFGAQFRPLWVGSGVLAAECTVALIFTAALRARIAPRAWRIVHWLGYPAWLLSVVHSLGTGTDARAAWSIVLAVTCSGVVATAVFCRLAREWRRNVFIRGGLLAMAVVVVAQGALWAGAGPLAPNWAHHAGTPKAAPVSAPLATQASSPNDAQIVDATP